MEEKRYTEKEIFEISSKWFIKNVGSSAIQGGFICTSEEFEELNKRFMTPQGFRKALEEAGLVGTKF